jgi:2-phosphosulfolactate phosphatase
MDIEVILTPAEIALLTQRDLSGAVCVVFDVLRATSTFLTALDNGARRIYPVASIGQARELHRQRPDALLGGERGGVRLEGFDLGNSPREYTPERVRGREIISTTTNGTVALHACAQAGAVYAGALLNVDALGTYLNNGSAGYDRLLLVCAGTGREFALEDGYAAGALLARLEYTSVDDAGEAMRALYEMGAVDAEDTLRSSANGRRLREIGLAKDVEYCAGVGRVHGVAILRDGALEMVRPSSVPEQ